MKKVFIGIDISKSWLDFAFWNNKEQKSEFLFRHDNDLKGINNAITKLIKKFKSDFLWVCFEHTGSYGLLLSCILENKDITYSAIPAIEIKNSLGMIRGKNDVVDSQRIAEYAAIQSHKLKPSKLPGEELLQVKQILTYRDQLVKVRTQFKNSLKSHKKTAKITDIKFIQNKLEQKIKELSEEIKGLEKEITELIKKKPEIKRNYDFITSVVGIGVIIGANMLVNTQNFKAFDNPRQYNSYAGVAPFEESSGTKKKKSKVSHLANKKMKKLLHNGVNSAINYDPQLRRYYKGKVEEGKNEYSVKNAVACKLISRAFATVKRQSKYVVLSI